MIQHVNDRDGQQVVILAKFEKAGTFEADISQKAEVLFGRALTHAAFGMSRLKIAYIELIMLVVIIGRLFDDLQCGIASGNTPLRSVRLKVGDGNPHGHTGSAGLAIGAVHQITTSAKPVGHQQAEIRLAQGQIGRYEGHPRGPPW